MDTEINDERKPKHVVTKIRRPVGDIKKTRMFVNPHLEEVSKTLGMRSVSPFNICKSPGLDKHLRLEITI